MLLSVATANLFYLPFDQALAIISNAGFQFIELDLYWERKSWAMAQHLKGVRTQDVVRSIQRAGLTVASIHDGGGVIEDNTSIRGFINPQLDEVLNALGYAPGCIIFHPPHIEGDYGDAWWNRVSAEVGQAAGKYRAHCQHVTIENVPRFDGYYVSLLTPEALKAFTCEYELGVTIDTTHYAELGVPILDAARTLDGQVRSVHLSDYANGQRHVFIGDGELELSSFVRMLDRSALHSITLECSLARLGESASQLTSADLSARLRLAREHLQEWLDVT